MKSQRILFLETKWKTHFWSAVARQARRLRPDVDMHCLVTNPLYAEGLDGFEFHRLDTAAPARRPRPALEADEIAMIASSDRMSRFYGARPRDLDALADKVWQVLDAVQPDLVIGEAVLPAELVTACLARHAGIRYLSPLTTRYPSGRFYLYRYESYRPLAVNVDGPASEINGAAVAAAIRDGRDVPDYMRDLLDPAGIDDRGRFRRYLRKQWLNLRSLLRRDPETPTFRSRLLRVSEIIVCKLAWSLLVRRRRRLAGEYRLLYPLQVQPEANLDVVGWTWSDQPALIGRIAASMPDSAILQVKANPKSKCEMNWQLIRQVWREPRCLPLPLASRMREVLPETDLVVTVTGTVALECIAAGKPALALAASEDNIFHPLAVADPFEVIGDPERWAAQAVDPHAAERYFDWVIGHSSPGEISDPLNHPHVVADANTSSVATAVIAALDAEASS